MATATEIERLVVKLTGENSDYTKMLKKSSRDTKMYTDKMGRLHDKSSGRFIKNQTKMQHALLRTAGVLKKSGKAMKSWGMSMSLKATLPIVTVGTIAVKAFADFDNAMIESTSIMDVTTQQIAKMRDTALSLSSSGQVLQGPKDIAKAYFYLASAGKTAEQSMALMPKMAAFATAGAFDMALATDLATDAQSALGLSSKNVTVDTENLVRVTDVLVKANTLANATVQQFSESLTNTAGATLKTYNKTVEEGVAVLAAYADQGVKGNVAGSNLTRITLLLSKAALKNAKAHEHFGFKVFDASGKMRNYADIIENLEDITRGMSDETRAATLQMLGFQARVQNAILPLFGTSKAIRRYERELKKAKGTTQEVADKQMKSFSNQMKVLWNQVMVLAISIGRSLAPILLTLNKILSKIVKIISNFGETTKIVIMIVVGLTAVIGPLTFALGLFAQMTSFALAGIVKFGTNLKALRILMMSTAVRAKALTFAFRGIVAVGISAFFIAAYLAIQKAREELDKTAESLKKFADQRVQNIVDNKQLTYLEKLNALGRERTRRIVEEGRAQQELAKLKKPKGIKSPAVMSAYQGLGSAAGAAGLDIYGIGVAEKQLERAVKSRKELNKEYQQRVYEIQNQELDRQERARVKSSTKMGQGGTPVNREEVSKKVGELAKSMQLEARTYSMTSRQVEIYKSQLAGANQMQIQQLLYMDQYLTKMEQRKKAEEDVISNQKKQADAGRAMIEQYMTPLEKYQKKMTDIEALAVTGALGTGVRAAMTIKRAEQAAYKEYKGVQKKTEMAQSFVGRRDAAAAGGSEAYDRIADYQFKMAEGPKAKDDSENLDNISVSNREIAVLQKKQFAHMIKQSKQTQAAGLAGA